MNEKQLKELSEIEAGADQSKPATQKTKHLNVITNRSQTIVLKTLIEVLKITFKLRIVGMIFYAVHLWGIKL